MAARKRELIQPRKGEKRYVGRGKAGQFTADQTSVGRSLRQDRRRRASSSKRSR